VVQDPDTVGQMADSIVVAHCLEVFAVEGMVGRNYQAGLVAVLLEIQMMRCIGDQRDPLRRLQGAREKLVMP
jgi:hypothetical protein